MIGRAHDVDPRYSRVQGTPTFRDGAFAVWEEKWVFLSGGGALGSRIAPEIVQSGGNVIICDPDRAGRHNLGNQWVEPDELKAVSIAAACERIRPGSARALPVDVRHVGVGTFARCAVLIDATDDGDLVRFQTELSNGLGIPLIRVAVDGTGERELGRVSVAHGGDGHACAVCTYTPEQLLSRHARTSCPVIHDPERGPTLAGGGIAMTVAGIALLQAQRLVGGNDVDQALDSETLVDLSSSSWLAARLRRNPRCLSGHVRWDLEEVPLDAGVTLAELFERGAQALDRPLESVSLEIHGHAIRLLAGCACGAMRRITGSRWTPLPDCACGGPLRWCGVSIGSRLNIDHARELRIENDSLVDLGAPRDGAMVVVRGGEETLRWVLR